MMNELTLQATLKALEEVGGKLIGLYTVMGEYDLVGIAEAPSAEVAMAFLLGLGADGNVRTTTFRAFSWEETTKIIEKLPWPHPLGRRKLTFARRN